MSRIWMPGGGGGGADLDVITTEARDILKGKVIVGPDGEPLTGTLELTGDAADSHVLAGKTYYNTDAKTKRSGAMPNKGAVTASLNCGGSYTIPAGYHNGSGKVTANSLASQTDATAAAGDILSGKTAYVKGSKVSGSMANQGAKTSSLNCGGSYTIPAGYHNGSGKVTANSLASQTDANASAGHILKDKTAWVKGSKITGTMAVQSILSFSAAPSGAKQVTFTWKNPAKGPFSGVIIVYKTGSYPTSITDGTRIYKGSGSSTTANANSTATCTMPSETTTYYFRAFSYATKDNAEWVHVTTYTATATTRRELYTFTSSGTFTVPEGARTIDIFCVGGGGGGGGNRWPGTTNENSGSGGGGGYTATKLNVAVTAGAKLNVTVGAGGAGGKAGMSSASSTALPGDGASGGITSVGSLCSANGGKGGVTANNDVSIRHGGDGGAGGGSNHWNSKNSLGTNRKGTNGGSNGSNGGSGSILDKTASGGTGQGTTTRAFGESSGTLYSGGGAGGSVGYSANTSAYNGTGGSGGGGNSVSTSLPSSGSANTGGGGGGAAMSAKDFTASPSKAGGNGGSGIAIIRVKY